MKNQSNENEFEFKDILSFILAEHKITQSNLSRSIQALSPKQGSTSNISQWLNGTLPSIKAFYFLFWGLFNINKKASISLVTMTLGIKSVNIGKK